MSFQIIVQPEARLDIKDGIDYYKSVSYALGEKFKNRIDATFEELKTFPNFEIRYNNVRMRKVKGFPYVIHFILEEELKIVRIYGVRFALQDPQSSWIFEDEKVEYERIKKSDLTI